MLIIGVEVFLDGENCFNHNFIINEIRWIFTFLYPGLKMI